MGRRGRRPLQYALITCVCLSLPLTRDVAQRSCDGGREKVKKFILLKNRSRSGEIVMENKILDYGLIHLSLSPPGSSLVRGSRPD